MKKILKVKTMMEEYTVMRKVLKVLKTMMEEHAVMRKVLKILKTMIEEHAVMRKVLKTMMEVQKLNDRVKPFNKITEK